MSPQALFFSMPLPFHLAFWTMVFFGVRAFLARRKSWGLPSLAVLGTVTVWYFGDVFYNDYSEYVTNIGAPELNTAWWEVFIFVSSFGLLCPVVHFVMNHSLLNRPSFMMYSYETRYLEGPVFQELLDRAFLNLATIWGAMMLVAIIRLHGEFLPLFAPYITGFKLDPWGRGQIGAGFDAFLALANYVQIFLTSIFGVILALSRNSRTRKLAGIICFLAFPYFLFDRTRNTMLATMIPGLLAWVFLRLKIPFLARVVILAGAFSMVSFWFSFVLANRGQLGIAEAFANGVDVEKVEKSRHEGLNMFEELGWQTLLIETRQYTPNMGERYLAEIANPIPRVLWKNKPMIGLDYAVARGQAVVGNDGSVTATISTGMIGQGVVNFGPLYGPIAAAFLMALWVAILARQDIRGSDPGHLLLYITGIVLTFNMGRDITLLVIYPFVFGYFILWVRRYFTSKKERPPLPKRQTGNTGATSRP